MGNMGSMGIIGTYASSMFNHVLGVVVYFSTFSTAITH